MGDYGVGTVSSPVGESAGAVSAFGSEVSGLSAGRNEKAARMAVVLPRDEHPGGVRSDSEGLVGLACWAGPVPPPRRDGIGEETTYAKLRWNGFTTHSAPERREVGQPRRV